MLNVYVVQLIEVLAIISYFAIVLMAGLSGGVGFLPLKPPKVCEQSLRNVIFNYFNLLTAVSGVLIICCNRIFVIVVNLL